MAKQGVILQAIRPKAGPNVFARVVEAVAQTQRRAAEELLRDYQKTTETWEHQPRWRVRIARTAITVYTDDAIWAFVDKGTRPHTIRARRAKVLAFASGYTAKTRPGSILSRPGGPEGETRFAQEVEHPGTKPRRFSDRLRAKWKKKWPADLQRAINAAGGKL